MKRVNREKLQALYDLADNLTPEQLAEIQARNFPNPCGMQHKWVETSAGSVCSVCGGEWWGNGIVEDKNGPPQQMLLGV